MASDLFTLQRAAAEGRERILCAVGTAWLQPSAARPTRPAHLPVGSRRFLDKHRSPTFLV